MDFKLYHIEFVADLSIHDHPTEGFVSPLVGLYEVSPPPASGSITAIARDETGKTFPLAYQVNEELRLCFDLQATLTLIRSEGYRDNKMARPLVARLAFDYSRLPIWMIGMANRILTRRVDLSARPNFPAYPLDTSADLLFAIGQRKLTARSLCWPDGKRYAVALTHDVDRSWLFHHPHWLEAVATTEERHGLRSAWYVVPEAMRNEVSHRGLERLIRAGHEIGVHGLSHDPEMANETVASLQGKLDRGKQLLGNFLDDMVGFRSPWLGRSAALYQALSDTGYAYDSSVPTSDFMRAGPRFNTGCGTVFPFLRDGLVVLPLTLPLDARIRNLGRTPADFWEWIYELIQQIKVRGGLALITTHVEPHFSAEPTMHAGYKRLIERIADDTEAWHALPRDIARWATTRLSDTAN